MRFRSHVAFGRETMRCPSNSAQRDRQVYSSSALLGRVAGCDGGVRSATRSKTETKYCTTIETRSAQQKQQIVYFQSTPGQWPWRCQKARERQPKLRRNKLCLLPYVKKKMPLRLWLMKLLKEGSCCCLFYYKYTNTSLTEKNTALFVRRTPPGTARTLPLPGAVCGRCVRSARDPGTPSTLRAIQRRGRRDKTRRGIFKPCF